MPTSTATAHAFSRATAKRRAISAITSASAWSASTCHCPCPWPTTASAAGSARCSATSAPTGPTRCASTPGARPSRSAGLRPACAKVPYSVSPAIDKRHRPQGGGTTMIIGMSVHAFTTLHTLISLIGILSGLIALAGLLGGRALGGWTGLFLLTTVLTSVTGFMFHSANFGPPQVVGVISLVALAIAISARYLYH